MEIRNKKVIIVVTLIIIVICLFIYFKYINKQKEYEFEVGFEENLEELESSDINEQTNENIIENTEEQKDIIVIHIAGEVNNPSVIYINNDSRIIDAINMAGGVTDKANLSKVNLAYKLADGMKIYIPSIYDEDEQEYISQKSGNNVVVDEGKGIVSNKEDSIMVNINTASEEELKKLPGIGSSIAIRIINYRNENGKFKTIEDLKNVSGIGDAKFNNIKNYICIK